MPFLPPNQQRQSTESKYNWTHIFKTNVKKLEVDGKPVGNPGVYNLKQRHQPHQTHIYRTAEPRRLTIYNTNYVSSIIIYKPTPEHLSEM